MKKGGVVCEGLLKKSELVLWNSAQCSQTGCTICHETFNSGVDICRVLDCNHAFHAKCIDLWFVKASCCPLCKNDIKLSGKNYSQRSLGRSSQTSSNISLGSASFRSGQVLVGHSNSDPVLLRNLQENLGLLHHRGSPPATPDRHADSAPNLAFSPERSVEGISISRSERSIGILSSSSSLVLPSVLEGSEEAARDSQRMQTLQGLACSGGGLSQIVEGPETQRSTGSNQSRLTMDAFRADGPGSAASTARASATADSSCGLPTEQCSGAVEHQAEHNGEGQSESEQIQEQHKLPSEQGKIQQQLQPQQQHQQHQPPNVVPSVPEATQQRRQQSTCQLHTQTHAWSVTLPASVSHGAIGVNGPASRSLEAPAFITPPSASAIDSNSAKHSVARRPGTVPPQPDEDEKLAERGITPDDKLTVSIKSQRPVLSSATSSAACQSPPLPVQPAGVLMAQNVHHIGKQVSSQIASEAQSASGASVRPRQTRRVVTTPAHHAYGMTSVPQLAANPWLAYGTAAASRPLPAGHSFQHGHAHAPFHGATAPAHQQHQQQQHQHQQQQQQAWPSSAVPQVLVTSSYGSVRHVPQSHAT
eukprot:TRINITY_DN28799_c0_g1_i1.p1 TRINITY_DN28799_c0_g1~~TRINITY_DN28799_c0_g1_i1.p1  ORF type:complete len:589 (+),score=86.96 TRINITY_DN28799_c0_g1_i1:197-1963(+)